MATQINPYKDVHKGIRKLLLELLMKISQTDFDNEEQLNSLRVRQTQVCDLLEFHSDIEDAVLAPLIKECCAAESLVDIESDHKQLHQHMAVLNKALDAMVPGSGNAAAGQQYYLDFSVYVSAQLQHMYEEETKLWPQLSAHFEDQQMAAFQAQARQMLPPTVIQTLFKAMIAAINSVERRLMLGGMQKSLSEEGFGRICALAQSVLPEEDWLNLRQHLGLGSAA